MIDSTYEDFESSDEDDNLKEDKKFKTKKNEKSDDLEKKEDNTNNEEDEFNVSLAKMEEEIKPKIINILDTLNKNYSKLKKIPNRKTRLFVGFQGVICLQK